MDQDIALLRSGMQTLSLSMQKFIKAVLNQSAFLPRLPNPASNLAIIADRVVEDVENL